jgi:tRNA(Ile)-lysidine synthase
VDHRLRPESAAEADRAAQIASVLDVPFVRHTVDVVPGSNLEARARAARRAALPDGALTGHTADDQAETVLMRLLRGSGGDGLAGIQPGPSHPILGLRRSETEALCAELGIEPVRDASNRSAAMWRNRVRHELLPLANDIAGRDVTPIIVRTAQLLRDDGEALQRLAAELDATDAAAIAAAHPAIARRALRRWLTVDGYPPDAASVERVLAVARGEAQGCELSDGRRVQRSRQRFRITERDQ